MLNRRPAAAPTRRRDLFRAEATKRETFKRDYGERIVAKPGEVQPTLGRIWRKRKARAGLNA